MYRGINALNVDEKGRIALPTRYREELFAVVVTIDTEEKCLLLYPQIEWEQIEAKIVALPSFNQAARRIQRLLIGHATELNPDNNGRIVLPPLLREYAGIRKEIMLVGQGKKFEIWNAELWEIRRREWLAVGIDRAETLPAELQTISL
jgi:MraZ protein